jgi:hypothetical protein
MAPELALTKTVKRADWRQVVLMFAGFAVVCAVVAVIALRDRLLTTAVGALDRSPPQATFSFTTEGGRVLEGNLTVQPGEVFIPAVGVRDDVDPSPTATVWLSPAGADPPATADHPSSRAVTVGSRMAFDEPGIWHMNALVTDASGNSMTHSVVISVFRDAGPMGTPNSPPGEGEPSDTIIVLPNGMQAPGFQEATSVGVTAAIEQMEMVEDKEGVHSIVVTIVVGSIHNLARLDRSHLNLFPLDDMKRPIPQAGWELIPESHAEYLPDKNVWRVQFEWEYDEPLSRKPTALRLSFAIRAGEHRLHLFADTDGIAAVPDAIGSLDASLSTGD